MPQLNKGGKFVFGLSELHKILAENPGLRNPESEWMAYKEHEYRVVKLNGNRVPLISFTGYIAI